MQRQSQHIAVVVDAHDGIHYNITALFQIITIVDYIESEWIAVGINTTADSSDGFLRFNRSRLTLQIRVTH